MISCERLNELSVLRDVKASTDLDYESLYDHAYKIQRYSFYGSFDNIDYFCDRQKVNTLKHDKHTYTLEGAEFSSIMPEIWSLDKNKRASLYRHYSSSLDDHILSTSSAVSGYTREASFGEIFLFQEIGTVPLQEFYSSKRKKHLFTCRNSEIEEWIPQHDSDFKFVKTVGYVYPGRIDPLKKATTITFIYVPDNSMGGNPPADLATEIEIQLKVYEGENIYKLTYFAETKNGTATITLPNTYSVICMNAYFKFGDFINKCKDITAYDYASNGYDYKSYSIYINKKYDGYHVTFEYTYIDVPVGS